jgi:zinc transporter ZupT
MVLLSFVITALFIAIHLLGGRLTFLREIPRSRWLSMAGGAAIAYVFIHLMPEMSETQKTFDENPVLFFAENHVYVIAAAGLIVFYGLERAAKRSRLQEAEKEFEPHVFRLHMATFSIYNFIIGYLLLHRLESGWAAMILYGTAMGFHFLTNDFGLRLDHRSAYDRKGRWVLAASVLAGWVCGVALDVSEGVVAVLFSFLAGGVILNVLKEELPQERESRFGAFVAGAVVYAALLLAEANLREQPQAESGVPEQAGHQARMIR